MKHLITILLAISLLFDLCTAAFADFVQDPNDPYAVEYQADGEPIVIGNFAVLSGKSAANCVDYMDSFLTPTTLSQFGAELVNMDDDEGVVHFHYCPMLGMWKRLSDDEKDIALICDCAMDVDRGIFDCYPDIDFVLKQAIGAGDKVCEIHLVRHKEE